jgi:hypothetical protein
LQAAADVFFFHGLQLKQSLRYRLIIVRNQPSEHIK